MAISLQDSYEECRQLNRYYGTPFYNALTLFPKQVQPHINAVLAFSRIISQVIDHPKEGVSEEQQVQTIKNFIEELEEGLKESHSTHSFLQSIVHTIRFCDIPEVYFHYYAEAMLADMKKKRYASFDTLKKHIDNTSGIIAKMIAHILHSSDPAAIIQIKRLARAGQIINLVCNVSKDYDLKDRIYIGHSDFQKFGYKEIHLKKKKINDKWRKLIEHYLQQAEKDVYLLQKGLSKFPNHSHRALHATSQIYLGLIEKIRRMDYDTFARRPDVAWTHRIRCALPF